VVGGFEFVSANRKRGTINESGLGLILDIIDHGIPYGIDVVLRLSNSEQTEFETIVLNPDVCILLCPASKTALMFWKCLTQLRYLSKAKGIELRLKSPFEKYNSGYSCDTLSCEQSRYIRCQRMVEDIADEILTFAPEFDVEMISFDLIGAADEVTS